MRVAILGLGIIGSRVAVNYAKAGHSVCTWNRTAKDFPNSVNQLSEVPAQAEILHLFVRDDEALLSTVEAVLPQLTSAHVVINSATVSPAATHQAAALVEGMGARFLDCPFTGSREAAGAGQLVFYTGGDADLVERLRPLLMATAKELLPCGKIGDATLIKVATNMISAVSVQVLAEALTLTQKAGLDGSVLLRAMENNASGSALVKMKLPTMLSGDYQPHFSLKNMLKDSRYALALAEQYGVAFPALQAASQRMADLEEAGHGELDYSALAKQFSNKA